MPELRNVTFTPPPAPGKVIRLEYETDDVLRLEVDPKSAGFYRSGVDLVVQDAGGDIVFINDFFHSVKGVLPSFTLPDGSTVSAREFFTAYAPDIETVPSLANSEPALPDYPGLGEAFSAIKPDNGNAHAGQGGEELMEASDSLPSLPENPAPEGSTGAGSYNTLPGGLFSPLLVSASEQDLNDIDARSGILLTQDERTFLCRPPETGEFRETGFHSLHDCSPEMLESLFAVEPLDLEALFPEPQFHTASGGAVADGDFMAVGGEAIDAHSLLSQEEYLLLLGQV